MFAMQHRAGQPGTTCVKDECAAVRHARATTPALAIKSPKHHAVQFNRSSNVLALS
jgi:hypothetical protein